MLIQYTGICGKRLDNSFEHPLAILIVIQSLQELVNMREHEVNVVDAQILKSSAGNLHHLGVPHVLVQIPEYLDSELVIFCIHVGTCREQPDDCFLNHLEGGVNFHQFGN